MQIGGGPELRLLEVIAEWNKAEKTIKIAEQINGEIVNPAIYELRYGGRRIVEALGCCKSGDDSKAEALLNDARFDCSRARHDAIDAATSKITADFALAVEKLGAHNIIDLFPEYSLLVSEINKIRTLIASSRENRENRDLIYETIASDNLDQIVSIYGRFQASEPAMIARASSQRHSMRFMVITTVVAILVSIASLIVAIIALR